MPVSGVTNANGLRVLGKCFFSKIEELKRKSRDGENGGVWISPENSFSWLTQLPYSGANSFLRYASERLDSSICWNTQSITVALSTGSGCVSSGGGISPNCNLC